MAKFIIWGGGLQNLGGGGRVAKIIGGCKIRNWGGGGRQNL